MNKITEKSNKSSYKIDTMSINSILKKINEEDSIIHEKIQKALPDIAKLVEDIVYALKNQGKLFYLGCGTSGRLGVLDAVECPPTFSTSPSMIQGIIAGGNSALFKSVENAEDSKLDAKKIVKEKLKSNDVLVAISANGSPAYVKAALKEAKSIKSKTCLITCNDIKKDKYTDHLIKLLVGPEIITGSTRMKAGTATKMVLNMISTTSMIKLNKTYGNLMIDLNVSNQKLKDRAVRIIQKITGLDYNQALELLEKANHNVKAAIVMNIKRVSYNKSITLLETTKGNLRSIIG